MIYWEGPQKKCMKSRARPLIGDSHIDRETKIGDERGRHSETGARVDHLAAFGDHGLPPHSLGFGWMAIVDAQTLPANSNPSTHLRGQTLPAGAHECNDGRHSHLPELHQLSPLRQAALPHSPRFRLKLAVDTNVAELLYQPSALADSLD